jgi:hypothetical protein
VTTGRDLQSPLGLVAFLASVFEEIGIEWALGGSLASSLMGEARPTMDIDLAARLDARSARELVVLLGDDFYCDEVAVLEAVASCSSFNVIPFGSPIKADIFVVGDDELDRRQISRRRKVAVLGDGAVDVWVTSPEDLILRKLMWFRRGGEVSERQWRDVVRMLEIQGDRIDRADLRDCAESLGITDLLDRAIDAARPDSLD